MKFVVQIIVNLTLLVFVKGKSVLDHESSSNCTSLLESNKNHTFKPKNYRIELKIVPKNWSEPIQIPANIKIFGSPVVPTNKLILKAQHLKINKASVTLIFDNGTVEQVPITKSYQECNNFIIELQNKVMLLDKLQIYIEYVALECTSEDCGFYQDGHGVQRGSKSKEFDNVRGIGANGVFPYFDGIEAFFDVGIVRRPNYTAVFNTQLKSTSQANGNFMDVFERTPKLLPEHIRFIVLSDAYSFLEWHYGQNETMFGRLYAKKSELVDRANVTTALESVFQKEQQILQVYTKFYGSLDRFPKMDFVNTGRKKEMGLLSWGISIDDPRIWTNNYQTLAQSLVPLTIKEHWLVETKQPKELNGAINAYIRDTAIKTTGGMKVLWKNYYELRSSLVESYYKYFASDNKQELDIKRVKQVLNMYEDWLTLGVMQNAVREYTTKLFEGDSGNKVTQDDFFECLHQAAKNTGRKVPKSNEMATMFTLEKFPIVTVKQLNATHVALTQEKYANDEERNSIGNVTTGKWFIPIKILGQKGESYEWLEPNQTLVVENNHTSVIMVDPNGVGYYRVLYDGGTLHNIQTQLENNPNVFHPIARKKLMDDYFILHQQKVVKIQTILALTRYLKKEQDYTVLDFYDLELYLLPIYQKLQYHCARTLFQNHIAKIIDPHLNWTKDDSQVEVGYCHSLGEGKPFEVAAEGSLKNKPEMWNWACLASSPLCEQYIKSILTRWKSYPEKYPLCPVSLGHSNKLSESVPCKLFEVGGKTAVSMALGIYRNQSDSSHLRFPLAYLGCVNDSTIITELINQGLNKSYWHNPEDGIKMMIGLAYFNPTGKTLLLDFLSSGNRSARFDQLRNASSPSRFDDLLRDLAEFGAAYPEKVKNFLSEDNMKKFGTDQQSEINQEVVENMQKSIKWIRDNGDDVLKWFNMK